MLAMRSGFLADRLLLLVLLAATLGAALSEAATFAERLSTLWLGVLVFGVGLTLEPHSLGILWRQPLLIGAAVLLPWLALIPLAVLAQRAIGGPVAGGLFALAIAPTEVSAVLLTVLAGGDAGLVTAVVASSLLLTPLVVPIAFALTALPGGVSPASLLLELALGVALPLIGGLVARARSRGRVLWLAAQYGSDLATVGLTLLVVGAGASARLALEETPLGPAEYALAATGVFTIVALPFGIGLGAGVLFRLARTQRVALAFACGMREFGVATAVAQLAVPAGAALPAAYGVVVMVLAAAVAGRSRASAEQERVPGDLNDPV